MSLELSSKSLLSFARLFSKLSVFAIIDLNSSAAVDIPSLFWSERSFKPVNCSFSGINEVIFSLIFSCSSNTSSTFLSMAFMLSDRVSFSEVTILEISLVCDEKSR